MQPRRRIEPDKSSVYSRWHCGDLSGTYPTYACWFTDIDYVAVTYSGPAQPLIAAVMEIKQSHNNLTKIQAQIYPVVAKALNVPFYIVRHNLETELDRKKWLFEVERYDTGERRTFNEEAYAEWLYEIREKAKEKS